MCYIPDPISLTQALTITIFYDHEFHVLSCLSDGHIRTEHQNFISPISNTEHCSPSSSHYTAPLLSNRPFPRSSLDNRPIQNLPMPNITQPRIHDHKIQRVKMVVLPHEISESIVQDTQQTPRDFFGGIRSDRYLRLEQV